MLEHVITKTQHLSVYLYREPAGKSSDEYSEGVFGRWRECRERQEEIVF